MSQTYTVEAVTQNPDNSIRSHHHPILESGNISFPDGQYILHFVPGADSRSFLIRHQIRRADLIQRLLNRGQAKFVCIVASPHSTYRKTHISDEEQHVVRWDPDETGEPPMFTPMIVCTEELEIELEAGRDALHKIWDKAKVKLLKGSRLALGSVIRLEGSIHYLLSLHLDKGMGPGQFGVEIEAEPFRFRVNLAENLHSYIQNHKNEHRSNILTHVVSACLGRLQRDFPTDDGEEGWRSHRSLVALAENLEQRGLKRWDEEDFSPETVATALYPHVLPTISGEYADGVGE